MRNMIKAGAVLSLTGRFAPQGEQARRGLVLWAEGVNSRGGLTVRERGRPAALQLLIYDDQSRTGVATAYLRGGADVSRDGTAAVPGSVISTPVRRVVFA